MASMLDACRMNQGLLAKLSSGIRPNTDLSRRGVSLTSGPKQTRKLPAAAWSQTFPAPGATLDLDFANNRGFVRGIGQGSVMDAVTFTRASGATYVGSDGLLKGYTYFEGFNILPYPEDFNSWIKTGLQTGYGAPAPNNTNTATLVSGIGGSSGRYLTQTNIIPATGSYTVSIYAKAVDARYIQFFTGLTGAGRANFDILTGNLGSISGIFSNAVITDVGNGWYRCSVVMTDSSNNGLYVGIVSSSTSGRAESWTMSSSVYLWGAQLETGSVATGYYPKNINTPRFDWAAPSAQISVPNLLGYTQSLTGGGWSSVGSGSSIVVNSAINPFGLQTATLLSASANTVEAMARYTGCGMTTEKTYTFSVYAKANGSSYLRLRNLAVNNNSNSTAWFNLTTGTIGTINSAVTAAMIDVGNGWYRCSITGTTLSALQYDFADVGYSNADGSSTVVAGNSIYVWGAQIELGTVATEYISYYPISNATLTPSNTCAGLLIEESRTNRILWCRDATNTYIPPANYFGYSETFTNAVWNYDANQTNLVRTTGFSDPIGGTTATKITPTLNTTAKSGYIGQIAGTSSPSTFSVYMKAGEYSYGVLSLLSYTAGYFAVFNLNNGTILTAPTLGGLTCAISDAGGGWYRCSLTVSSPSLNKGFLISVSPDGTITTAAGGSSGIYIWGSQAENGTNVGTYTATTTIPATLWILSNTSTSKNQTGVDGITNAASSITATANGGTCIQTIALSSGARTSSAYLKRINGTGDVQITFDGAVWSSINLSSSEWRRIISIGTVVNPCFGIKLATSGDSVAMDFAQIEDGSFETSPIYTGSTSATRASDVTNIYGEPFKTFYNCNGGTFYGKKGPKQPTTSMSFGTYAQFRQGNSNGGQVLISQVGATADIGVYVEAGTGASVRLTNAFTNSQSVAVAFSTGVISAASTSVFGSGGPAFLSGAQTCLSSKVNNVAIGYQQGGLTSYLNNTISRIIYWPSMISTAGLQRLVEILG